MRWKTLKKRRLICAKSRSMPQPIRRNYKLKKMQRSIKRESMQTIALLKHNSTRTKKSSMPKLMQPRPRWIQRLSKKSCLALNPMQQKCWTCDQSWDQHVLLARRLLGNFYAQEAKKSISFFTFAPCRIIFPGLVWSTWKLPFAVRQALPLAPNIC